MYKKSGLEFVKDACRRKIYHKLLESYLQACRSESLSEDTSDASSKKSPKERFPNLAGFCRFLKIGAEDLSRISEEFPDAFTYICTALEDEALNSSLSPTLLNNYLKRRLGYDEVPNAKHRDTETQRPIVQFEHDIFRDGE